MRYGQISLCTILTELMLHKVLLLERRTKEVKRDAKLSGCLILPVPAIVQVLQEYKETLKISPEGPEILQKSGFNRLPQRGRLTLGRLCATLLSSVQLKANKHCSSALLYSNRKLYNFGRKRLPALMQREKSKDRSNTHVYMNGEIAARILSEQLCFLSKEKWILQENMLVQPRFPAGRLRKSF